jgi:hypothetical protein
MALEVLTPDLWRAPTAVVVSVEEAAPDTVLTFSIDGTTVGSEETDVDGYIHNLSLPVPATLGAGTHTVSAGSAGSDTFTLAKAPATAVTAPGAHAAPVAVAGTLQPQGHYRWVLQDLLPGGLGSWVMPKNPTSWTSPILERQLTATHTTARTGHFHVTEGSDPVFEFSFTGLTTTQAEHDSLAAFAALNRRFYLIDHRNRAWIVTFTSFNSSPRRRATVDGVVTDWLIDYTMNALVFEQDWQVPA